jgi:hypothetical protein
MPQKTEVQRLNALIDGTLAEAEEGWVTDRAYTEQGMYTALTLKLLFEARNAAWEGRGIRRSVRGG